MSANKYIIVDFGKISTPYCGLAEVALNFSDALNRLAPKGLNFIYIVPTALRSEFDQRIASSNVLTPKYKGINRILYYLTGRPGFLCQLPEYDVYHYLHFYSPWGPNNSNEHKTLLTIHDFHALERKRAAKRLVSRLNKVTHLAFISNFAFKEYERLIDNRKHVTRVITNGVKVPPTISEHSSQQIVNKYGKFLFTLGGLKRKNIHSLLGMLQITLQQNTDSELKLLIAGSIKDKYKNELVAQANDRNIADHVVFLGAISEQEKFAYMQACRAFVFPSLQEGFGLPVIEALHLGKPVFCSNKTSLPEVGGDHVYYWDKFDAQYMADILLSGLTDNDLRLEDYIAKRKHYALTFDWEQNAKQYVNYYQSIITSSK